MFCFNLKNRRHCIGNLALPTDKYMKIKAKLLEEMRQELSKKKKLPRLEEIAAASKPDYSAVKAAVIRKNARPRQDMAPIRKAYAKTCNLVLGKPPGDMEKMSRWLSREAATFSEAASCVSGERLMVPGKYAWFRLFPKDRLVTLEEADQAGEKLALDGSEVDALELKGAPQKISKIAFFCPVWRVGNSQNVIDCPTSMDSANCFRCEINIGAKNCAHTFWPRDCDSMVGSFACMASSHSLKCYFSRNLSRCFEVDASRNCTGCYFCHNCENVHDSIFCFNVKNLRYAIGNAEVGKEEFLRVKKLLLDGIAQEAGKSQDCRWSVYNLASGRKK
jgi:hypothetical protein